MPNSDAQAPQQLTDMANSDTRSSATGKRKEAAVAAAATTKRQRKRGFVVPIEPVIDTAATATTTTTSEPCKLSVLCKLPCKVPVGTDIQARLRQLREQRAALEKIAVAARAAARESEAALPGIAGDVAMLKSALNAVRPLFASKEAAAMRVVNLCHLGTVIGALQMTYKQIVAAAKLALTPADHVDVRAFLKGDTKAGALMRFCKRARISTLSTGDEVLDLTGGDTTVPLEAMVYLRALDASSFSADALTREKDPMMEAIFNDANAKWLEALRRHQK